MNALTIGICDDSALEREEIESLAKEYFEHRSYTYEIRSFSHMDMLKDALRSTAFHILLLDVRFDNDTSNSIPFAKRISEVYPNMQIIFITNYPEYFPDVYICQHVYCIQKSDLALRLPDALNKAIANINAKNSRITVTSNYCTYILDTSQIIYLEKNLRKITFIYRKDLNKPMTPDNIVRIETYGKFSEFLPQLPESFIQTHQSYVINLNYIRTVKNTYLILLSGQEIQISRKFKPALMEQLKHFIFD